MENMGSKNLHEQFRLVGAFCVISPLVSEQIKQYKGADQLPSLSTTLQQWTSLTSLVLWSQDGKLLLTYMTICISRENIPSTQKHIMANMHQLLYHQNSIEQFLSCELAMEIRWGWRHTWWHETQSESPNGAEKYAKIGCPYSWPSSVVRWSNFPVSIS